MGAGSAPSCMLEADRPQRPPPHTHNARKRRETTPAPRPHEGPPAARTAPDHAIPNCLKTGKGAGRGGSPFLHARMISMASPSSIAHRRVGSRTCRAEPAVPPAPLPSSRRGDRCFAAHCLSPQRGDGLYQRVKRSPPRPERNPWKRGHFSLLPRRDRGFEPEGPAHASRPRPTPSTDSSSAAAGGTGVPPVRASTSPVPPMPENTSPTLRTSHRMSFPILWHMPPARVLPHLLIPLPRLLVGQASRLSAQVHSRSRRRPRTPPLFDDAASSRPRAGLLLF
jgi:hypothetical protein